MSVVSLLFIYIYIYIKIADLKKPVRSPEFVNIHYYSILANIPFLHTLTGHFIRYTLLVPGWTPFCLHNYLNSSWHRFKKVLEKFLRDFYMMPYLHDGIGESLLLFQFDPRITTHLKTELELASC